MQRRNRDNFGVLLLVQHLLFTVGIENIPPVTLTAIGLQVGLFLGYIKVPWKTLQECCISTHSIFNQKQYFRFFSSALEHSDSMHLYYNTASFVWKGIILESVMGAPFFAYLLFTFTILTGLISISINYALATILMNPEYMFSCAVGFSGVIFALKVVVSQKYSDVHPYVGGFHMRVPGGMYVWFELILISLVAPRSSWVGHLAGILVGMAYSKGLLAPIYDIFGLFAGYYPHRHWDGTQTHYGGANRNGAGDQQNQRRTNNGFNGAFFQVYFPQVTCLLMLMLCGVFYHNSLPPSLKDLYRYVGGNCLNSYLVVDTERYGVLLTAPLHTLNRLHLLYCLVTLYKVGGNLEHRLGAFRFALMSVLLTAATGLIYIGLVRFVLTRTDSFAGIFPYEMKYKCFMGPTGVLLALKLVHSYTLPTKHSSFFIFDIGGLPLIVILIIEIITLSYLFPQAWLVGNIAGVFAGLMCVLII